MPYKKIVDMNSFFIVSENDVFFEKTEFYSDLKQKAVSDSDYESSYYLYSTLKMRNLGDMNDLYNPQDVTLLCEIIENRFQLMQEANGYNPRKCNSSSTLSGCIVREMSKVIIALPTSNEVVDIFEKTLTGGFSCVNTRLAFDTEILLPNSNENENDDVLQKDHRYKLCYKLKLDSDSEYKTYRIMTKILKLDENNQYGFAMTKLMPTGCIKNNPDVSWRTFNHLLETVDLDDKTGHLFIVDIKFDYENASSKQRTYNEIYPPIIEKQKIIGVHEKSTYQLLEQYKENSGGTIKSYRASKKAYATLFKKRYQPLYLEHLALLIKRAGWKVTKIYSHWTFEQERFKRNFILKNQTSRQNAKNAIEKDFYRLMNNANFGFDCRNNLDNCQFVPIFDELKEVTYLKKYYNYFDQKVKSFVTSDLIKADIDDEYNNTLNKLSKNDQFYQIKRSSIETQRKNSLDSLESFNKKTN